MAITDAGDQVQCRLGGTDWARSDRSVAVGVPSVIIPTENNILLNPSHPDFARVAVAEPSRFRFDPGLLKLGPNSALPQGQASGGFSRKSDFQSVVI